MQLLYSLDIGIVEYLAAHRTPLGIVLAFIATDIGSTAVIAALTLVILVYFAHKHRHLVIPFVVMIFGSVASFEIIKNLVERMRPPAELALYTPGDYSFPSGHATTAVVFFGFLAYYLAHRRAHGRRIWIYAAATLLMLLIGVSRVYLGVHYPSDVLAGFMLGALWLWIGIKLIRHHA